MVSLGDEGFLDNGPSGSSWLYNGAEGVDWKKNLDIPTLDYGTVHVYPDSWKQTAGWGNSWINDHDTIGAAVGKPVVIEEYGILSNQMSTMSDWQKTLLASGKLD